MITLELTITVTADRALDTASFVQKIPLGEVTNQQALAQLQQILTGIFTTGAADEVGPGVFEAYPPRRIYKVRAQIVESLIVSPHSNEGNQ